jgi:hypothetical protein
LGNIVQVDSTSIFPKFSDRGFFPYWEIFGEVEHEFGNIDYLKFMFHRRSDIITYNLFSKDAVGVSTTTIAGKLQYETVPRQSLLAIWEHQWKYDDERITDDKRTLEELITLQYSFNPLITFGIVSDWEIAYENGPYHVENNWFTGFASARIGDSHTILVSYGSERGGLNCTGGICRLVPPFQGLRVTLTSQI